MDIGTEHQVDRPLAIVDKGKAAPWVLLIGFDTAFKSPILNHQNVPNVSSLLAEAEICCTVIQGDIVCQLDRDLNYWFNLAFLEIRMRSIKQCDGKLFLLRVFD